MNQDQQLSNLEKLAEEMLRLQTQYTMQPNIGRMNAARTARDSFFSELRAALTATQQAAPEYMHPVAILTKEVKPEHWEPQQAAPSQGVDDVCSCCAGSGSVTCMTSHLGPDDYEFEAECEACHGTGSADVRDAINALSYQPHTVKTCVQMVDRAEVLRIIDARAALLEASTQRERPAADDKAEEEILQLIGERDRREEIINQLCDAVLGTDRSEWSSAYHFEDAVREVEEQMAADDKAAEPLLVRDLAEIIGKSVPTVCAAIAELGFDKRSTNMALRPDEAVAAAKHFDADGKAGGEVWAPTEAQYMEWCDRHGMQPTDREAFFDAASLYLSHTSPQPQADQPAERVALTTEQKRAMFFNLNICEIWGDLECYLQGIEDAERAHGITEKDQ